MGSEYFYIVFSLMVISAALSLTFFMAWRNFGRKSHALTWSVAFLAGSLQWLCSLNADVFPNTEEYLLVESALSMVLVTLGPRGHCPRTKCTFLPKNLWPYVLPVYAIIAWHIAVDPHVGIRMTVVPAFAALTMLLSAYMILTHRERTRPAEWVVAIGLGVFAITQVGAASLAFMQGATGDESIAAAYRHFNFLTLPAGYVVTSMLIILMMASDISAKLKKMAVQDQLTGLLNRRGFEEYGSRAFAVARRTGQPMSVIMTDIDRFKYINDKFGHAAGDMGKGLREAQPGPPPHLIGHVFHHRRGRKGRADRVHADAACCVLIRRGPGDAHHRMFGRRIKRQMPRPHKPRRRGHVQNRPLSVLLHQRDLVFHAQKHALDVDIHHPVEIAGGEKLHRHHHKQDTDQQQRSAADVFAEE